MLNEHPFCTLHSQFHQSSVFNSYISLFTVPYFSVGRSRSSAFCHGRPYWFPEYAEKNLAEQGREPKTNSTHIWSRHQDSNLRHIGGRQVLSPLHHPFSLRVAQQTVDSRQQTRYIQTMSSPPFFLRDTGLSSRAGGRGFSPAAKRVDPGYFYWKMEEKQNQKKSLAV